MANLLALKALLCAKFATQSWWGEHHSDIIVEYLKSILTKENNEKVSETLRILIKAQNNNYRISNRGKVVMYENLRTLSKDQPDS